MLYSGMLECWNTGVLGLNSEKVYFLIRIGIYADFAIVACGYDG
jgi:hypothetical protein